MQTRVLLILLLCGVCFSCHSPQQDKQESDLTKVNNNMTNEQLREKLALAFSGATSEEDLVVAKYGIERMKGYISSQQEDHRGQ